MGRRMGRSIRVLRPRLEPRPRENATEIHLRSYRLEETLRSRLARTPHTSNTRPRARRNPLTNTTVILQVHFDLSFDNTTWHFQPAGPCKQPPNLGLTSYRNSQFLAHNGFVLLHDTLLER